jgi:hypothetical protein
VSNFYKISYRSPSGKIIETIVQESAFGWHPVLIDKSTIVDIPKNRIITKELI